MIAFEIGYELWIARPLTGERAILELLRLWPIVFLTRLAFTGRVTKLSSAGIFGYRWGLVPWETISRLEIRPHVLKVRLRGRFFSRPFHFLPFDPVLRDEAIRTVRAFLPPEVIVDRR